MKRISRQDKQILSDLVSKYDIQMLCESSLGKKLLRYAGVGIMSMSPNMFNETPVERAPIEISREIEDPNEKIAKFLEVQRDAAEMYISENLRKIGKTIDDVQFDIMDLVVACYEQDYDLPLLLAQLQIESHFGTDGNRQNETKSLFSVGLGDDGINHRYYETYKDAIDDYIKLMKTSYLQNGDVTVDQLLRNFVNRENRRYASSQNYESDVRRTRNAIIKKYPELAEKPI